MMENIFVKVFSMSMTAGFVTAVVLVLRALLRKAPKSFCCFLWLLVGIRLVCPYMLESRLSLVPDFAVLTQSSTVGSGRESDEGSGKGSDKGNAAGHIGDNIHIIGSIGGILGALGERDGEAAGNVLLTDGLAWELAEPNAVFSASDKNVKGSSAQYFAQQDKERNESQDNEKNERIKAPVSVKTAAAWIWVAGAAVMLLISGAQRVRLARSLRTAVRLRDNIWQSEKVPSPFVMGMIRPRIYLSFSVCDEHLENILLHEREHIRHGDNIIKPLAFVLLALHWFNPMIWAAYIFLCIDIEQACDERVVRRMDGERKKAYAESIFVFSMKGCRLAEHSVTFGGGGVKERIRRVLDWRKSRPWLLLCAVVLCCGTALCCLTNPQPVGAALASKLGVQTEQPHGPIEPESSEPRKEETQETPQAEALPENQAEPETQAQEEPGKQEEAQTQEAPEKQEETRAREELHKARAEYITELYTEPQDFTLWSPEYLENAAYLCGDFYPCEALVFGERCRGLYNETVVVVVVDENVGVWFEESENYVSAACIHMPELGSADMTIKYTRSESGEEEVIVRRLWKEQWTMRLRGDYSYNFKDNAAAETVKYMQLCTEFAGRMQFVTEELETLDGETAAGRIGMRFSENEEQTVYLSFALPAGSPDWPSLEGWEPKLDYAWYTGNAGVVSYVGNHAIEMKFGVNFFYKDENGDVVYNAWEEPERFGVYGIRFTMKAEYISEDDAYEVLGVTAEWYDAKEGVLKSAVVR